MQKSSGSGLQLAACDVSTRDSSSLSMFVHRLRPVIRYLILAAILTCQLNAGNLIMPLIDSSCHRTELHRTTSDHRSTALQRNGEKLQPHLNIWRLTDLLISAVITPPPIGERSIVMSVSVCVCVCLSVCSRSYLRNYTSDLHDFYACYFYYSRDSVLFWRCSDMLRRPTFGFMGDVIFAHKPRLLDVASQLRRSSRAEA